LKEKFKRQKVIEKRLEEEKNSKNLREKYYEPNYILMKNFGRKNSRSDLVGAESSPDTN
jgi:hypothetical protein